MTTRRDVLKAAAAAWLAPRGGAKSAPDVLVIGAGLSGLVAALRLKRRGRSVVVLEARDRTGGRVFDRKLGGGEIVEMGAQWIGPGQTAVHALARELGVAVIPAPHVGRPVRRRDGTLSADSRPAAAVATRPASKGVRALEAFAATIDPAAPWTSAGAAAADRRTLADWLASETSGEDGAAIARTFESVLGPAADLSLLHAAFVLRSAGGVLRALTEDAQQLRFAGGAGALIRAAVEACGAVPRLSAVVGRLASSSNGVEAFEAGTGSRLASAARVVVAMSPADAAKIVFDPPLPRERSALHARWRMLPSAKAHVVYARPFWRDDGLSGEAFDDEGPFALTADHSPARGGVGVLSAFLRDPAAARDEARLRREATRQLVALFGSVAATPHDFTVHDWSRDPFSSGCASPLAPGTWTSGGVAWRAPFGRVHWAGAETSEAWNGYLEGAVRSGERVAAEIDAALPR